MTFFSRLLPRLRRLRPALLPGLMLALGPALQARPRLHYAVEGNETPVALLRTGPATYLVTQQSVFRLEGRQFVRKYRAPARIQCAAAADTVLWLGTPEGVVALDPHGFRSRVLALPLPDVTPPNVVALFTDAHGSLWAGVNGLGVFRWAHGVCTQELTIPSVNAGVATADSSVWIATNLGLNRKQGAAWTRYNEEGVANHELPDNIVEKLLPDNAGNLWVVMSDALCVFEAAGQRSAAEAELPTVKFLGRPGNEVFSVAALPGTGRLFATAMGLLLLPNEPTRLASFAPATDKVEPQRRLVPLAPLPGAGTPMLLEVDKQHRLWLVGAEGIRVLTRLQVRRWVQANHPGQKTVATNPVLTD